MSWTLLRMSWSLPMNESELNNELDLANEPDLAKNELELVNEPDHWQATAH